VNDPKAATPLPNPRQSNLAQPYSPLAQGGEGGKREAGEGANAKPKPIDESPFKGKTGLTRLVNAAGYSWAGLRAAFRHEDAFRQEILLLVPLLPAALILGENGVERALLVAPLLLVVIVELLNSAIEAAVDRVSLEHHPLIKRAKDMGSAAVMLSLVTVVALWALVLLG
jgi:diacylglycerol kinase (ATP)